MLTGVDSLFERRTKAGIDLKRKYHGDTAKSIDLIA